MPHNRFFSSQSIEDPFHVTLDEEESHHAIKVMRLHIGDALEIVDGLGHLMKAKVIRIEKKAVVCEKISLTTDKKIPYRYILAQGLLRHTSMELVCEKATELGVEKLWIFSAAHSEKNHLSEHQIQRLYKHRLSALKQCGRLLLPEISFFSSLEELMGRSPYPIYFGDVDPLAKPLKEVIQSSQATFVVGPESGFDEKETDLLKTDGAKSVSLHRLILRAETAAITACAQLSCLT